MNEQIDDSQSPSSVSQGDALNGLLKAHKVSSLYGVLGVGADCTNAEIQSAIAVLKNRDLPLSAEQSYAVEILGDPEDRRRYDAQLIIRLSPTRIIAQHDAEPEDSQQSASPHNRVTMIRPYRLLIIMLCLAFAGVGGWSYYRGPLMQTRVGEPHSSVSNVCFSMQRPAALGRGCVETQ